MTSAAVCAQAPTKCAKFGQGPVSDVERKLSSRRAVAMLAATRALFSSSARLARWARGPSVLMTEASSQGVRDFPDTPCAAASRRRLRCALLNIGGFQCLFLRARTGDEDATPLPQLTPANDTEPGDLLCPLGVLGWDKPAAASVEGGELPRTQPHDGDAQRL